MRTMIRSMLLGPTLLAAGCASLPGPDAAAASGSPLAASATGPAEDPLGPVARERPLLGSPGLGAGFDDSVISTSFDPSRVGGAPAGAAVRYRRADGSVGVVRPSVPYAAASGRACRALLDATGARTGRTLCAAVPDGKRWELVPRLGARDGAGNGEVEATTDEPLSGTLPVADAFVIALDETLWEYGKRLEALAEPVLDDYASLVTR